MRATNSEMNILSISSDFQFSISLARLDSKSVSKLLALHIYTSVFISGAVFNLEVCIPL